MDPKRRFSERVSFYVKFRPHYPDAVFDLLQEEYGLAAGQAVADLGAGTGILSRPFLRRGLTVYGVEPNAEMRGAAETYLADCPGFVPVDGAAEVTSLPDGSVEWISAGQAFHWFDVPAAAIEARRILRPGGMAILVWNTRRFEDRPFSRDYEALLQRCSLDYHQVSHARRSWEADFRLFFGGDWATYGFDNRQYTDLDGLRGRTLSASYAPLPGHPNHRPLVEGLHALFERYAEDGQVFFGYETQVYVGPLRGSGVP